MQKRFVVYGWLGVALVAATAVTAQPKAAAVTAAKHPSSAQDWSALRSAHATGT